MRYYFLVFICGLSATLGGQTLPQLGKSGVLEVANWNIEWFGDSNYGPTDEEKQQKNVAEVISSLDFDVWGLCEVSSAAAWDSLLVHLPEYSGVISTWSQTQKTALLFKKNQFTFLYQRHILSTYSTDFASGRLPLEVALKYQSDTIYFIVVHLKANVGTNTEKQNAYDRRKAASVALKGYLDTFGTNKSWMVLGDWNDDVDVSIFNFLESPFSNMVNDSVRYFFPSRRLSLSGHQSTASYTEMIDHQCVSKRLRNQYIANSCQVFRADSFISGYATNTSDHFPVYSVYYSGTQGVEKIGLTSTPFVYWDGQKLVVRSAIKYRRVELYDPVGRLIWQGNDMAEFCGQPGALYLIRLSGIGHHFSSWILIPDY